MRVDNNFYKHLDEKLHERFWNKVLSIGSEEILIRIPLSTSQTIICKLWIDVVLEKDNWFMPLSDSVKVRISKESPVHLYLEENGQLLDETVDFDYNKINSINIVTK